MDEFWTYVGSKKNKVWLIYAYHRATGASMPAADRATITAALGVEPIMINSALVSAQHRRRLYWTNLPGVTQPEDKGILLCDILEGVFEPIPIGDNGRGKAVTLTARYGKTTLSNTQRKGHYKGTMVAVPICLNAQSGRKDGRAKQPSLQDRVYSVRGKMVALTSGFRPSIKVDLPDGDYLIRKLAPAECERLQTLPDGYTAGISSTQRYKCLGNGWTADVIAHILGFAT